MRKFAFSLLLFLPVFLAAQHEFAPLGAKWFYNHATWQGEPVDTFTIEVAGIDTIQGHACKRLESTGYSFCAEEFKHFYEENRKVYSYNESDSTFQLYIDFAAEPGVRWSIKTAPIDPGDSMIIQVDFISWFHLSNGDSLRVQHISFPNPGTGGGSSMYWGDQIMERIGIGAYFYPQVGSCDAQVGPFFCYSDHIFQEPSNCAALISTVEPQKIIKKGLLMPNPASGVVSIRTDFDTDEVLLLDIFGKRQKKQQLDSDKILFVSDLVAGIYVVQCFKKGVLMGVDKLVILQN